MNLDALTDIVSNGIGMLVLLCLVAFLHRGTVVAATEVPIQRQTSKSPVFLVLKEDRVLWLDPVQLSPELGAGALRASKEPAEVLGGSAIAMEQDGRTVLRFGATAGGGWLPAAEAANPESSFQRSLSALEPNKKYLYAFVYDAPPAATNEEAMERSGLRVWSIVQELARERKLDTGWTLVDDTYPVVLCFYTDDPHCDHRPSTPLVRR